MTDFRGFVCGVSVISKGNQRIGIGSFVIDIGPLCTERPTHEQSSVSCYVKVIKHGSIQNVPLQIDLFSLGKGIGIHWRSNPNLVVNALPH